MHKKNGLNTKYICIYIHYTTIKEKEILKCVLLNFLRYNNSMRLNKYYIDSIKTTFHSIFEEGNIYLFGSRVDDTKKGGDIDLYIEVENKDNLFDKKIKFLSKLKQKIDNQKIDVIFNEDPSRLIEREAKKWAIAL